MANYTYQSLNLSEAEKKWLKLLLDECPPDSNVISRNETWCRLVKFHEALADGFEPSKIDSRCFANNFGLSLVGLYYVDNKHLIFTHLDTLLIAIKNWIIKNENPEPIFIDNLVELTRLDEDHILDAVPYFGSMGFFDMELHYEGATYTLSLPREHNLPKLFRYKNIHGEVEDWFVKEGNRRPSLLERLSVSDQADQLVENRQTVSEEKNTAFIIMPIDSDKPELEDVCNAYKEVCKKFGISARRADEIEHQENITDVILREIERCEFLIADLSYERPNVYYEIGYAHAITKRPILFRKKGTKLHFDLSVHNVPEYENITSLTKQLDKRFEALTGRKAMAE